MQTHGHLPNEVLALILTHITTSNDLYQCALVNKSFNAEIIPLLWRNPQKCQTNFDEVAFPLLNSLQSTHRHLGDSIRRLEFSRDDPAPTIVSLLAYTPLIEELDLKEVRLDAKDPYLSQIFAHCPRLKTLHLFLLTMNDTAIISLGESCHELQHLNLSTCVFFPGYKFDSRIANSLKSLTLTNLYAWSAPPTPLGSFPHLTHLDLSYCRDITASMIRQYHLPCLTDCRIVRCNVDFSTDPDALLAFVHTHSRLENLTLEHCKVDDRALVCLPRYAKVLTELDLACNGCPISSYAVRQLIKGCGTLQFVGLDFCGLPITSFPESDQIVSVMGNLAKDELARIRLAPDLDLSDEVLARDDEDGWTGEGDVAWILDNFSVNDI